MKLVYFDAAGRAEAARLLCLLGDVEFEDVRINREQWAGEYKAKTPTGQCPYLELDDGKILCQSTAIGAYVAELGNLRPSDPLLRARELEMAGCFDDAGAVLAPTFAMAEGPEKTKARQDLMKPGGNLHNKLSVVEKLLAMSTSKYYVGDKPGVVDVSVLCFVAMLTGGFMDGIDPSDMNQFSKMMELAKKVISEPKVRSHYSSKPEGTYQPFKGLI